MTIHTPGPTYPVTLTDGRMIRVTIPLNGPDPECYACTPGYSLCPLHAAAPELLVACKRLLLNLDMAFPDSWEGQKKTLAAVIRAATGKE